MGNEPTRVTLSAILVKRLLQLCALADSTNAYVRRTSLDELVKILMFKEERAKWKSVPKRELRRKPPVGTILLPASSLEPRSTSRTAQRLADKLEKMLT